MDKLPLYINIGLGVYFGLLLLFSILFGIKRGLGRSISRLVTIILSLPIAYFLSKFLLELAIDKFGLVDTITETLSKEDISFSKDAISPIMIVVTALCIPLAFILVYFIVNKIMFIFYAISKKFIAKGESKGSKIGGVLVSMLTCTISFCTLLLPLNGYIGVVDEGATEISEFIESQDNSNINKVLDAVEETRNSGILKFTKGISDKTFKLLTKTELTTTTDKTIKTNAKSEIIGVLEIYQDYLDAMLDSFEEIAKVLDYKGKNSISAFKISVTTLLKEASVEWKEGKEYLGKNIKEEIGDDDSFNAITPMLDKLSDSNEDNIDQILLSIGRLIDATTLLRDYLTEVNNLTENQTDLLISIVSRLDQENHQTFNDVLRAQNTELDGVSEQDSIKFVSAFIALFDELYDSKLAGTLTNVITINEYDLNLTIPGGTLSQTIQQFETSDVESVNFAILKFYDYIKNKETYNATYFANADNMNSFCLDLNKLLDNILYSPALFKGTKAAAELNISFEVYLEEKIAIDTVIDSKKTQSGITSEQQELLERVKTFFTEQK